MIEAAERDGRLQAGRHDRRADLRQHRRRPGAGRAAARVQVRLRLPGQGQRGQAQRPAAPTAPRSWCARPRSPRSTRTRYYKVSDRLVREIPGAWKPNQYSNPGNPDSHYETTGPEIWRAHRRHGHPFRRGRGHRRHDQRHGPLPQGGVRRHGEDRRRRPGGLGVLRRHRPAVPGRGRRRGLLAQRLRPGDPRRDHRGLRRRLLRDDPAAGPRGGPAGRRLLRHGGGGGAAGGRAAAARTTWSWCCCPTAAAATCPRSSTTSGCPPTASCSPDAHRAPTVGDVLRGKSGTLPDLVHTHPNETVAEAIAILREYGVSQMPVVRAEPPVMAAEVAGASTSATCSTRCSPAGRSWPTGSSSTCRRRCR